MERSLSREAHSSTTTTLPTSEVAGGGARRDAARVTCESDNRTSGEASVSTARGRGDERGREEEESAECSSSAPMDADPPTVQVHTNTCAYMMFFTIREKPLVLKL